MAASRSNISPVSVAYVLRISNYSFKSTLGECMRWHEEYADRRLYTCSACHSCLPRSHVSERSCLRNIVDRRVQSGFVLSSRVGIMKRQFKTRQRRKFKFSFDGKNRDGRLLIGEKNWVGIDREEGPRDTFVRRQ